MTQESGISLRPARLVAAMALGFAFVADVVPAAAQTVAAVSGAEETPATRHSLGMKLVYAAAVPDEDTRTGLRLVEEAAAAGHVPAMVDLSGLYLYGTVVAPNLARARELAETAAAAGNGEGLLAVGSMLMWGERDAAEGERLLVRAGEMGVAKAWVTLAEGATYGYLGGGKVSRAKFAGYADKARAAGQTRVDVLEANRLLWGISVTASGPEAVAVLTRAADGGNADAARMLIPLLRDGNGVNVRRDPAAARVVAATYRPLLTEAEAYQYDLTIAAAESRDEGAMADVAGRVLARPEMLTRALALDLQKANGNVAMRVVQQKLTAAGFDAGASDGYAGTQTLRAMYRACLTVFLPATCDDTVMRPDVIASLITTL